MAIYAGEPLNILHTIGLDHLYPIIRCEIKFDQQLDRGRFSDALTAVAKVVPEILCKYQLATNSWETVTDDVDDLIHYNISRPDVDAKSFDLMNEPQLRIYWNTVNNQDHLIFYVSHILTDGAGCKQLLYLLAKAYSVGLQSIAKVTNRQDVDWLMTLIKQRKQATKRGTDHPTTPLVLPELVETTPVTSLVGSVKLKAQTVSQLVSAAHQKNVTLNDIFMAAFGRTIQRYGDAPTISLACPTDMRQFIAQPQPNTVRVANHTSRYNLSVESELDDPFEKLITQVHQGMAINKANHQCFDSISDLLEKYEKYPLDKLQQIVEDNYHVREIAYTNFGIIDHKQLVFDGAAITDVTMTGSFRRAPMFQIAVATFNNQTSLSFNMDGTKTEYDFGMALARNMADLIDIFALQAK